MNVPFCDDAANIMHQSFVTIGPTGPGNGGDNDFLFAKPRYMLSTGGTFL